MGYEKLMEKLKLQLLEKCHCGGTEFVLDAMFNTTYVCTKCKLSFYSKSHYYLKTDASYCKECGEKIEYGILCDKCERRYNSFIKGFDIYIKKQIKKAQQNNPNVENK